jgi:hypothetical protein
MESYDAVHGLVILAIIVGLYFIPYWVALSRMKNNRNAILIVNLIFGWTFIGWIVALVWAVMVDNNPRMDHIRRSGL